MYFGLSFACDYGDRFVSIRDRLDGLSFEGGAFEQELVGQPVEFVFGRRDCITCARNLQEDQKVVGIKGGDHPKVLGKGDIRDKYVQYVW